MLIPNLIVSASSQESRIPAEGMILDFVREAEEEVAVYEDDIFAF